MNENSSNEGPPDESATGEMPTGNEADSTAADSTTSGPGRKILWLAVLLLAGALAVLGYRYVEWPQDETLPDPTDTRIAELTASLAASREAIDTLDARIAELAGSTARRDQRFADLENQLADQLRRLDALPGRVGNLESAMASLRGISSGLRDAWLLAEAEYYMQIANAQLQLAANPKLAGLALQLADEKIQQLANPALTNIRRALADELRALNAINNPDVEGIALTLSSLATVVDSLPLDEDIDTRLSTNEDVDSELTGMDRLLASLKRTASDVVSVRRSDETVRPLIAPEAQYFLRANLALQLQAARIALLRSEQTLFDQSLDDAAAWLNRYYDVDSTPVRSALQTISEARQNVMPASLPDISGSLRLLREYRVLSASGRQAPATAEKTEEPGETQ
jgi:uroporphyrin-3 C-methyltransferase